MKVELQSFLMNMEDFNFAHGENQRLAVTQQIWTI
jgi:hypothetical protein